MSWIQKAVRLFEMREYRNWQESYIYWGGEETILDQSDTEA